jgi:hypothetical protein
MNFLKFKKSSNMQNYHEPKLDPSAVVAFSSNEGAEE